MVFVTSPMWSVANAFFIIPKSRWRTELNLQKIQDQWQQINKPFVKYAISLLILIRQGNFLPEKKVYRLYENMRMEYELSVRLEDKTGLAKLNGRADEKIKKPRGKKADQTD